MLTENLLQLGFSQKEATVYLGLVRFGPLPASSLSRRVNLKRVTVYSVLSSLEEKGVVCFRSIDACREYLALDPEQILYALNEQMAILKIRMRIANECVHDIQKMRSRIQHSRAAHLRG